MDFNLAVVMYRVSFRIFVKGGRANVTITELRGARIVLVFYQPRIT